MRHFRFLLLACTAVTLSGPVDAADMPWGNGPAVISDGDPMEEEIGSGWYLRGDIGWARGTEPKISYSHASTVVSDPKVSDRGTFGGGFGYKFDMFRADLTVDSITRRRISWTRAAGCYDFACGTGIMNHGRQSFTTFLANAYVDLGNWAGITPYVGAGIGVAYGGTSIVGYTSPTVTSTVPSATYTNFSFSTPAANRFSLAAAAMAGASYTIGSGLMLDLGYRFLWVDNSRSGNTTYRATTVTNPDASGVGGGTVVTNTQGSGRLRTEDLGFHQFRVGLRYFVN
mgnify:CR=1 FL=1